jgi:hypothetical protein
MEQEGLVGKLVAILDDNATADFSVGREVGLEIVTQATEGVAKLSARIGIAAAGAIWKKIRSSVADRKFEQQWARAKSRTEQEFAVRQLIESSPKLARDLNELLQQRAYLIAVREHCQELPFLSSIFPGVSIRDVFVDLPVRFQSHTSATSGDHRDLQASAFVEWVLSQEHTDVDRANYACFGGPGSGKSMLCRSLVAEYCERILLDADKADDATLVLPAYVRGTDLIEFNRPFVESLKLAIERELGPFLKSSLDTEIFEYRRKGRTRRWFVVVDGIDEIADREKRLKLVHAIRVAHIDGSNTFRFFISSRDSSIPQEVLGKDFHIVALGDISTTVVRSIFTRYSAALGRNVLHDPFLQARLSELRRTLATPLIIAIASSVLSEPTSQYATLSDLFDDFVKNLLAKRGFSSEASEGIRELLCDIAELGERIAIDRKILAQSERLGLLEPALPTILAKQKVLDSLMASGLVLASGNAVRFIHASFRQFFRAGRFAGQTMPAAAAWHSLDPYGNGWDFVQFVVEKWNADGHDLGVVCGELLSYGRDGLKLFSRVAGQNSHLPHTLISAAIAKWRVMLEEDGAGHIDDAVDNLSVMARNYDAAVTELHRIALDHWNYFEDSIEAARCLAQHNRVQIARDALMRITTAQYPPDQARAAEALCEIGFRELGINLLKQFLADWAQPGDEEFLGYVWAIEALHQHDEPHTARVALDVLAKQDNLRGLEVHLVAEAYAEVINKEAAIGFLKDWLAKHPQIAHSEEILLRAQRDINDHKLADLLQLEPSRDYEAERSAEFQKLSGRVTALPGDSARLLEIVRNAYVGIDMRCRALKSLAQIDDAAYREAAMEFMADCNVAFHAKRELISELRSRGCDIRVAEVLMQHVARTTDHKVSDAELLIRVGARTKGIELLQAIASNPNARPTEQAEAICALANFGASKFALTRFRALLATESCAPSSFEKMAKALLVTQHAADVEELLWGVLRNRRRITAIRLNASRLLSTPELKEDKSSVLTTFLRWVATRKTTNSEDRFEAIDQLRDFDLEAASDLCYEITADPDTPFEEGMQAARRLQNWADEFTAIEGYENVVWDKKISLPQRVEGLLHIHRRVFWHSDDDDVIEELISSAREELLHIAQDTSVSADIRLKALALPGRDSAHNEQTSTEHDDWPSESAIEAFLRDENLSPRIKQECVLRFCMCRSTAISKYLQYLRLRTDDVALMFDCLRLLEKTGRHELALRGFVDLTENIKITLSNRLKAIREIHRIGEERLALRLAEQISRDERGTIRIPPVAVTDFAEFFLEVGSEEDALKLCREALDMPISEDDDSYLEIVGFLAREGFSLEGKVVLRRLLEALSVGKSYPDWLCLRSAIMLADLGETGDALEVLTAIAGDTSMDADIRIAACRWLFRGNHAEDVKRILRELSCRASLSEHDRIDIAECCADLGLTQWAQEHVLEIVKDMTLSSYARKKIRNLSMRVGLKSQVELSLAQNGTDEGGNDDAKLDQIEILLSMERWDDVKGCLIELRDMPKGDPLDMIETLGKLEETPLKEFAKVELRRFTADGTHTFEKMRAAEILQSMGRFGARNFPRAGTEPCASSRRPAMARERFDRGQLR